MGRMLESLKFGEAARLTARDAHFFEDSLERELDPEASDTPFIEVGPNRQVEGSPQVLLTVKHPPQLKVQPPHQSLEKFAATPIVPELTPARPMQVDFQAWPSAAPATGVAPEVIVHHQPEHPVSKQYAALLDRMLETERHPAHVLLFTGGKTLVGTSTVVLNLGAAGARAGRKEVVVVDGHLRKPGLAQRLGLHISVGIQDVFGGKLALEQAVVKTPINHLHVLPAHASTPTTVPAEGLRWLVSWLRERFELILVDGPSVDAGNELGNLITACDGLYLVLPQGETSQMQRGHAQTLAGLGGRLRGVVHTHIEM